MKHPNKVTVWLPDDVLTELRAEAQRQGRTLSWLCRRAWRVAGERVKAFPGAP